MPWTRSVFGMALRSQQMAELWHFENNCSQISTQDTFANVMGKRFLAKTGEIVWNDIAIQTFGILMVGLIHVERFDGNLSQSM